MKRSPNVDEAEWLVRLYGYRMAVAARIGGCTYSPVWKRLHPEKARESTARQNARRGPAKRRWELENRASCERCGDPLGKRTASASERERRSSMLCNKCVHERAIKRLQTMAALALEGVPTTIIATALGMTAQAVANYLSEMRRLGMEIPYTGRLHGAPIGRATSPVRPRAEALIREAFPEQWS